MGPQIWTRNLAKVRAGLAQAASAAGRSVDSVTLLAVSKGHPAIAIETLAGEGVRDFGESYVQEALPKLDALAQLPLTWHYIGRLQANKTRVIAERFAWVHALDRVKLAERLSAHRSAHSPVLNVCLQVNLDGDTAKGGVEPRALAALADIVATLPHLKLRGLMTLPREESDPARQHHWFSLLRASFEALRAGGHELDTLSMGMSGDYAAAIAEGATIVRLGTALFGPRE